VAKAVWLIRSIASNIGPTTYRYCFTNFQSNHVFLQPYRFLVRIKFWWFAVAESLGHQVLKRPSHEIFDLWFFHKSTAPRPLVNTLKYFRIPFRIRRDIRPQTVEKSTRLDSILGYYWQGPRVNWFMKNTIGRKSRETVSLRFTENIVLYTTPTTRRWEHRIADETSKKKFFPSSESLDKTVLLKFRTQSIPNFSLMIVQCRELPILFM
jgi:hypothetical protein